MSSNFDNLSEIERRQILFRRLKKNQGKVAERIGVSREYFNKWLNGKHQSQRVAKAFETYANRHGKRKS